jgi:hypothetical protein
VNGDVDGNNRVNATDLVQLRNAYGSRLGAPGWNANADLNGDNRVNATDLIILRNNYSKIGAQ